MSENPTDICPTCNRSKSAVLEVLANNRELLSKALRAICLMRDYCPTDMPALEGYEWFDVGSEIAAAIPHDEWAREFKARVEVDQHHRKVAKTLRGYLFSKNPYAACETPMFSVLPGFLGMMGFSDIEQRLLIRSNAVHITDEILTEQDKAKAFEEHEVTDGGFHDVCIKVLNQKTEHLEVNGDCTISDPDDLLGLQDLQKPNEKEKVV